jgi:hypothetical protein
LANCAFKSGRIQEAETLYERALALIRKPDGEFAAGSYDAPRLLRDYAAFLRAIRKDSRAAELEGLLRSLESEK